MNTCLFPVWQILWDFNFLKKCVTQNETGLFGCFSDELTGMHRCGWSCNTSRLSAERQLVQRWGWGLEGRWRSKTRLYQAQAVWNKATRRPPRVSTHHWMKGREFLFRLVFVIWENINMDRRKCPDSERKQKQCGCWVRRSKAKLQSVVSEIKYISAGIKTSTSIYLFM